MDSKFSKKRLALLVLRAQASDREAVDRLLEIHQGEVFGYLTKMLGNHSDAEDALQATLLQAVNKIRWLREPAYFRSWVFRIASRKAFQIIEQQKRRREISNAEFIDVVPQKEVDDSEQLDLIELIPEWLDRLTPVGREAITLHYLNGFTTEQVADILDIPLGTAKSRISYSLSCIRKQINIKKG